MPVINLVVLVCVPEGSSHFMQRWQNDSCSFFFTVWWLKTDVFLLQTCWTHYLIVWFKVSCENNPWIINALLCNTCMCACQFRFCDSLVMSGILCQEWTTPNDPFCLWSLVKNRNNTPSRLTLLLFLFSLIVVRSLTGSQCTLEASVISLTLVLGSRSVAGPGTHREKYVGDWPNVTKPRKYLGGQFHCTFSDKWVLFMFIDVVTKCRSFSMLHYITDLLLICCPTSSSETWSPVWTFFKANLFSH